MWADMPAFAETAIRSYRRDVWAKQSVYLEVWLEKDALSGIFEDVLDGFGVTLNVGRGYDGWDSLRNAAVRFGDGRNGTILYYGDFDPSGEDMVRSLRERLAFFGCQPTLIKCALVQGDIARYRLPPDFTKATDTRRAAFVATYGDVAVELDALPTHVLTDRLRSDVAARMDMTALISVRETEKRERKLLIRMLTGAQS